MSESKKARTADKPAVIVSCDSHVGPLLEEQLRNYCPKTHLEAFDDFVKGFRASQAEMAAATESFLAGHPNVRLPGHHDIHERLRDMDHDGVAAEVIYHFSTNGEPLPFVWNPAGGLGSVPADQLELGGVGYQIYNRWLADFVSVEPERHIGLAYLPMWDVDAAVKELEAVAEAGLRGVNFPPPSRPGHLEYNNPAWEPFWSACEDLGMSLNTHSSNAAAFDYYSGEGGQDILIYECGGWMARRAIWWMIHGRVFERHPRLKLVITEQYEGWWTGLQAELDAVYMRFGGALGGDRLPKLPSEYLRSNVYMGASFMSQHLAEEACREGYVSNVVWGRDYPHVEGTFQHLDDPTAEPITKLSLRHVLSRVPEKEALMLAGGNAIDVYGLDAAKLAAVAERIGAPTAAELADPPRLLPEISESSNAFRGQANPQALVKAGV